MPCQDHDRAAEDLRELRERLDKVTRIACHALQFLEDDGRLPDLSKEAKVWWRKHKKRDEMRREHEAAELRRKALREGALAKLTPKERKLLGLP